MKQHYGSIGYGKSCSKKMGGERSRGQHALQATLKLTDQKTMVLGTSLIYLWSVFSIEPKASKRLPLSLDGRKVV